MRVLVKAMAGSHLFGTDTPSSDKDYKGVYLPSKEQILLGNYSDAISHTTGDNGSRNTKEDVDTEYYSVKKFLKMVKHGDTAALELLFTPSNMILEYDPLWEKILLERDRLLSKKVGAMIGYARQQANKYGIKGSRMGELNNIIQFLKELETTFDFPNAKLKLAWPEIVEECKKYAHVHIIDLPIPNGTQPAMNILGKKFGHHDSFPHVLSILKKIYKNYGQRAREAKNNNGIDWKALSHAVRVMSQGIELMTYKTITLPLPDITRQMILDIKLGKMNYDKVSNIIENYLDILESAQKESNLPDSIDDEFIKELTLNLHMEAFK